MIRLGVASEGVMMINDVLMTSLRAGEEREEETSTGGEGMMIRDVKISGTGADQTTKRKTTCAPAEIGEIGGRAGPVEMTMSATITSEGARTAVGSAGAAEMMSRPILLERRAEMTAEMSAEMMMQSLLAHVSNALEIEMRGAHQKMMMSR
mmetsp:Transcript_147404/g.268681  ORF Transcript_147404/g.268681 Transcript_147404/m.268681 type:complete len:151 (-) Transcript_147404:483-935(-)